MAAELLKTEQLEIQTLSLKPSLITLLTHQVQTSNAMAGLREKRLSTILEQLLLLFNIKLFWSFCACACAVGNLKIYISM